MNTLSLATNESTSKDESTADSITSKGAQTVQTVSTSGANSSSVVKKVDISSDCDVVYDGLKTVINSKPMIKHYIRL